MIGEYEKIKNITLQCQKHGEYTGAAVIICPPGKKEVSECPACRKEIDAEKLRQKDEQAKQHLIQKWRSMNIDDKYYESTFDNFDAYNDELRKYLEICRSFSENPDGKLIMLGKNGNGKTHLAVSVLKKLGGVIYTAFEIGVNLRQSYNGDTKEHEVFDELCTVPLLVIDEVEKIKDSESKQNWMSHVIGKRYNRMLPIIIIANCHTQKDCTEQKKPCPYCLEYHLESDVISRIIEDGIIMKFNSGDYRRKIREERFGL
jgi:DNA replication protein DnaC